MSDDYDDDDDDVDKILRVPSVNHNITYRYTMEE